MNIYTNVHQSGNKLLVRGVAKGRRFNTKIDFYPTVWMSGKREHEGDPWYNLQGKRVYPVQPGTMYETKKFIEEYKDVHGFEIYESPGHTYQFIAENFQGEIRFDPNDISVFTVDIETETEYGFPDPAHANEVIQLITVKDTRHKQVFTWGLYHFDNDLDHVTYKCFSTEQALLTDFIQWWSHNCPDVITGWNSSLFDITYLYNRMVKVIGDTMADKISPWGQVRQTEVDLGGRTAIKTYIAGVASLDYLDLYKKFTYVTRDSYKLDNIASIELGTKKIENPGATFKEFYQNYWDTFVRYNIRDVELVDELDGKLKLIDLALTIAYAAKVNYEDVFSPVKTWDVIIYNYLNERNIVIPRRRKAVKEGSFEGAYVKDPIVGKHNWNCSFDLNSLYPHIIMQYNMSPETITDMRIRTSVDELLTKSIDMSEAIENDYAVAANGWCYRKDKKGVLPTQMQRFYDLRVVYKKEMLEAKRKLTEVENEMRNRGLDV